MCPSRPVSSLIFVVLLATAGAMANAQSEAPSELSVILNYGQSVPVAYGMNGTATDFFRYWPYDPNATRYPFGEPTTRQFSIGLRSTYRFAESPWSLMVGVHRTSFAIDTKDEGETWMGIWAYSAGGEWTMGRSVTTWNVFSRAALVGTRIDGAVVSHGASRQTIEIPAELRLGYEGELGIRYNLRNSPVSLEASINYTNANAIGRTFVRKPFDPIEVLRRLDLNDAPNPDNPDDPGRTIDYLTVQGGVKVRF